MVSVVDESGTVTTMADIESQLSRGTTFFTPQL